MFIKNHTMFAHDVATTLLDAMCYLLLKLMKVGFLKDGMIQTMFPYLTIAAFVSLMLLGTNSF